MARLQIRSFLGRQPFRGPDANLGGRRKKYAPHSLGVNNQIHATIHRRYALEELRYPVWGMSPSSAVARDSYAEYGVKVLGARGYKCGVVTPHASALALSAIPQAAVSNLRRLAELYGHLWRIRVLRRRGSRNRQGDA